METSRWNIHDLTQMALLVALLSVSAYIAFPIPITLVSVTAQTLFLNLDRPPAGPAEGRCHGGRLDSAGSGGRSGLLRRSGRTEPALRPHRRLYLRLPAGRLPGIALLKGDHFSLLRYLLVTICVGIPIIDLAGAAWYMVYADIGWGPAFLTTALPFLPGDLIKSVAAVLIAKPLSVALSKLRKPSAA